MPFFGNMQELRAALLRQLLRLLAAVRFLTIIRISWRADQDGEHFPGSLRYFVFIGGIIGIVVGGVTAVLRPFLPASVIAVGAIILLAGVSGCLHLDGLADTADGFFSSRPKERILEIMRDSRTGAMGVIALVMVLLLKFASLSSLPKETFFRAVCLMPIAGRCAILLMMSLLPYARKEGGLGRLFYSEDCRFAAALSFVCLAALAPFAGLRSVLVVLFMTMAVVILFSSWCRKKIDGATGDTLGAACEIAETAAAVALAGLYGRP